MVFSSLRSRNRHSANPNPRLHTGPSKDTHVHRDFETHIHEDKKVFKHAHNTNTRVCREKEARSPRWQQFDEVGSLIKGLNGRTEPQHDTPSPADTPPPSPYLNSILNDSTYRSNPQPPTTPPHPPLSTHSASSLCSPPSPDPLVIPVIEKPDHCHLPLNHTRVSAPLPGPTSVTLAHGKDQSVSCENGVTEDSSITSICSTQQQWESRDSVPKKKRRKSSMPVKLERGKVERR